MLTPDPQPSAGIRKLSYFLPISGVERYQWTPEEEERIRASEAEHAAEDKALRERHAWLLEHAPHPILRALIEAHRPDRDGLWADCPECPRSPGEIDGDDVPEAWPCPVWRFISDRMESP
jgi:hypothetical protein